MQNHLPYYELFVRKHPSLQPKLVENLTRDFFGHYKIGEKWASEKELYEIVKSLFSHTEVVFHYRGKELNGLELDIWLPEYKIGIEYQGIQHYKAVEHWGGEDGLIQRINTDSRKKLLCKTLGYKLLEIKHDEPLEIHDIESRIKLLMV